MTWLPNDEGIPVPRRTSGSVAAGYTQDDFTLACKHCEDDYGNEPDLPIGVVAAHFDKHHPDVKRIELNLLWLGQGPSPEAR